MVVKKTKKTLLTFILLILSVVTYAQKDVTKFLGIPVDGSKSEMIQKLKSKGFTNSPDNKDVLVGEFNGTDVNISVVTNNNKVYRILVCDANTKNEADIKIRFNNLCYQFKNNERYVPASLVSDYTIPDDEKISYGLTVQKKRYEASYYQLSADLEATFNKLVWFMICELYGKYYIAMFYDNEYNKANGEDL